tara:strand:- start:158 stop:427 length:270 start_codon:yes stop_codon:yes gene_type:complete
MEFYQYLLRNNGFKVSDTGYFVYCNGIRQKERFDEKLDFEIYLLDYMGNDGWIEKTLSSLIQTIKSERIPSYTKSCEYCEYQVNTKEFN